MNLEWWVVAVELHVDATYYVQHPTLKSVHLRKKPISNTLFSLKDSVWTSTESSRFQNKWFELLLWETFLERNIGSYVKIGYLHHFIFMCSIIICFRKAPVLWQQLTREEHPRMGSKAPSSPKFPICLL